MGGSAYNCTNCGVPAHVQAAVLGGRLEVGRGPRGRDSDRAMGYAARFGSKSGLVGCGLVHHPTIRCGPGIGKGALPRLVGVESLSNQPFFHLRKPARRIGSSHVPSTDSFSYPDVGATRTAPPMGWEADRLVDDVGVGREAYERAKQAIRTYQMFRQSWVELIHADPLAEGAEVVFASRQLGLWTLNACRVVYIIEEEDDVRARFGFAYGTLANHAVAGEERFLATWDKRSDIVDFEVFKFSLPRHPLVRVMAPIARSIQRKFSEHAVLTVKRAVQL
ncbi:MAG: hypothetical protein ACJATT_005443 [Myxococcota bacterium]|jgi:uncharacterized protein (UPF0548 family)